MLIKFLMIPGLLILSCGSVKQNPVGEPKDSMAVKIVNETGPWPACIKKKLDSFKLMPRHEQPQKVLEYLYKGKKVYYIEMPCCDFFNEVYDANCNLLGAPDGGFTGKGDGKLPDFHEKATNEKLVWKAAQ